MNFDEAVWSYEISPAVQKLHAKYVDNFTEAQKFKIKELRNRMGDSLRKKIHNDFFLSKWLISKKWDLNAATAMLKAHFKWREEWKVDQIHEEYTPQELFVKYVPIGIIGDAKNGSPFYIFNIGNMDPNGLFNSGDMKELMKYIIYNFEYGEKLMLMNTEKYGTVISKYTSIVDMENFPYKDFLWKTFLEFLVSVFRLTEDHYPGVIGQMFVVNVVRIFAMFYGIFKPFLRDDTKTRIIVFTKTDPWKEAVLEQVDKEQVPVHWGGTKVDVIDGNPYCSSHISLGGEVPKSFNKSCKNRMLGTEQLLSVKVKKREAFTVDIEIPEDDSTLAWSFWTEENDIGFGVNKGTLSLVPVQRYQCEMQPEKGSLQCQESGTYTLVFDNTFSIFKSKKVCYEFQIISSLQKSTSS